EPMSLAFQRALDDLGLLFSGNAQVKTNVMPHGIPASLPSSGVRADAGAGTYPSVGLGLLLFSPGKARALPGPEPTQEGTRMKAFACRCPVHFGSSTASKLG